MWICKRYRLLSRQKCIVHGQSTTKITFRKDDQAEGTKSTRGEDRREQKEKKQRKQEAECIAAMTQTNKAAGITSQDQNHALNTYTHTGTTWSSMITTHVGAQSVPVTFICTC